MKRKGFTLIELIIVIAIISGLTELGIFEIDKIKRDNALFFIKKNLGTTFRDYALLAKYKEERIQVKFQLREKKIIFIEGEDRKVVDLPDYFEYIKISEKYREEALTDSYTTTGNMSKPFTFYILRNNKKPGIQGDEEAIYAIRFTTTRKHIRFLKVSEYQSKSMIPISLVKPGTYLSRDVSNKTYWKEIK